jgi:hypothetical protein
MVCDLQIGHRRMAQSAKDARIAELVAKIASFELIFSESFDTECAKASLLGRPDRSGIPTQAGGGTHGRRATRTSSRFALAS